MKIFRLLILLFLVLQLQSVWSRTVEIDVQGMTCAFCIDGLQRKFRQMQAVSKVQVSLKLKKVRLVTEENQPDLATLKQTVIDAGFTPTKISILSNEKN